jgi:Fur family ferric uptake transcriptional regulator
MDASDITQALKNRGLRVTAQRAVILETLAGMPGHQTAQDVYDRARPHLPGLNLATVYRTLDMLHHEGLVDRLDSGGEVLLYTYLDQHHRHAHLICRRCGHMYEIDPNLLQPLVAEVAARTGFRVDDHHQALTGLCASCASLEPAEG